MASSIQKSFIWSFLEQGGVRIAALVVQIVLARLLSPETFGILAIMLVIVNVADAIAQSGLGVALIQKKDLSVYDYSTAFWLSLGLGLIIVAILMVLAPCLSSFYGMDEMALPLQALSTIVVFNSINSIQRSFLQRNLEFKQLFIANVLAVVLSGALGIVLAFCGFGIWALVAQALAQSIVACAVFAVLVPQHPALEFSRESARSLFAYGWKICVSSILGVLYVGVSELVIGKSCSASELGFYSQGRKWPDAGIAMVSNALQNVFLPVFSSMQDDLEQLRSAVLKYLVLGTYIVVPFVVVLAVIARPLIVLLLGEGWLRCVPVFQCACLANVALMIQLVNLRAYMALGYSDLYLKIQAIKVVWGIIVIGGAALVSGDIYVVAIVYAFLCVFNVVVVDMNPAKRILGISRLTQIKLVLPIGGLALLAGVISYSLSMVDLPALGLMLVQVIIFAIVYLGLSAITRFKGFSYSIEALRGLAGRNK